MHKQRSLMFFSALSHPEEGKGWLTRHANYGPIVCRNAKRFWEILFVAHFKQVTLAPFRADIACNPLGEEPVFLAGRRLGLAPHFPWMVKGTPDAGKSSRTCDVDAEAADRRSRLPIDEPEPR